MTDVNSQPNRYPHNSCGGGFLYTAVSYVALSIATLALPANAQTVINNGTVATTTSANNGETISVESGTFVSIANAPAVVVANNDVRLANGIGATVATTGQTQTVQVNAGTTGTIISLPIATSRFLGQSRVIDIAGAATLVNNGVILGTGNQRNGTVFVGTTANGTVILNGATGIIDAGAGNLGAGFSAELLAAGNAFTITNAGSIVGRGNDGAGLTTAGDGLRLERTRIAGMLDAATTGLFTGTITNSGTISSEGANGTVAGLRVVNGVSFQGTINNSGTISGTQNGVYFGNSVTAGGAVHTGGVVNNLAGGTISSGSRAFNIDGTGLVINNAGRIIGTGNQRNGTVYTDETASNFTLNNQATGIIDAGVGNQGAGYSAETPAAGTSYIITNAGSILGRGNADAMLTTAGDGLRLERTRGADGLLVPGGTASFSGTITNSGLISSEATNGTVAGLRIVDGVGLRGTITNAATGVISGVQNGVYIGQAAHTGGIINNAGTISSGSRALNIDGTGLVVNNSGRIIGTGNQRNGTVYSDDTASGFTLTNQASGIIDAGAGNLGAGFSAELLAAGNAFTITNAGSIVGRGNDGAGLTTAGDGLRLERTRIAGMLDAATTGLFTGTITNSGTISSEGANRTVAGLRVVNGVSFQGTINNSGTISGTQNGVYFGNSVTAGGAVHTGGVVNNLAGGTISSGSRAFNIDGTGLVINNAGRIIGTGNQRNGTVYGDATANSFTFNNQASGLVDVGVGRQGSGVSLQLGAAANDSRTFTITNAGNIAGRGAALPSGGTAGVRLFSDVAGVTASGMITNSGTISAETGAAFLIERVNFNGTITNNGTISGPIAVDASAATGGVRFVQNGGALTGNFVGSNFVDSFTLASGNFALANNFVNGVNVTLATGTTTTVTGARALSGDLIVNGALNLDLGVSSIEVTGNTTLGAGSRINIATSTPAGVLRLGQAIDVLTDTGSFTNNGALVTVIDDDFLVDYRVTFGSLQVTPVAANLAALSTDGNISAFGGALANALTANQLPAPVFAGLNATTSAAQFEQVALTLLPALNEGTVREIFETQNAADSFVIDRLASAGTGLWGQVIARKADRDAESLSVTGYDADAFGFSIGVDAALGEDIRIGAVYSYADIGVDQQGGGAETSDINASNIAGYVGYNSEKGFVNGLVGYSFNRVDTSRGGAASPVTGKFDLKGIRAQANAGYVLSLSNIEFTPYAGLIYASLSPDNYTETGGLGLIVDAEKVNYLEGKLGVRLASVSQNSLSIRTNLAYAYDFIGDARDINLSFAGSGSPFRLTSGESTKSRFEFGAGIGYGKQQGFSISLDYQGELASGYNSHAGVLRLRYGF